MFSKANLPADAHSPYARGSTMGSTNHYRKPLLNNAENRLTSSIHDHNTVTYPLA
jgi:hypothetical protein